MTPAPADDDGGRLWNSRWTFGPPPPPKAVQRLEESLRLPPALCRLLAARRLLCPDEAKRFLRPRRAHLLDPAGLRGAPEAARRLAAAVERRERILVHGDYDADGIAGTALAVHWLRELGAAAEGFVPSRRDGYDLSRPGLERAVAYGADVLMTVDCGIRALEWVGQASEKGIDVLVTDHHLPGPSLPPALAVVDPNQPGCGYENKQLCGAAVAFKVVQLAARLLGRSADEAWRHLDLAGVATVADLVPLVGENRALARLGLHHAGTTGRPGLRALVEKACRGLREGGPDSADVAYRLAPRLNAAGRVGEPETALRLLLSDDDAEARRLAGVLEGDNALRKSLQKQTLAHALAQMERECDPMRDGAVVLAGDDWHAGVIGIVASQIVEQVARPVVLFAMDEEIGRGSARSVPQFDIHAALQTCSEHLDRFGGHSAAAGMDIRRARLDGFGRAFRAEARRRLAGCDLRPAVAVDLEVGLEELRGPFFRYCRYMGPFGQGNPEPVFAVLGARARRPRRFGDGSHVEFRLDGDRFGLRVAGFGMGGRLSPEQLSSGAVDVAFTLSENRRGPYPTVEAVAVGIRPSGDRVSADGLPEGAEVAAGGASAGALDLFAHAGGVALADHCR